MGQAINVEFTGPDVSIDVTGIKGAQCELETRDIEKAIGVVQQRTKTPDYRIAPPRVMRKA